MDRLKQRVCAFVLVFMLFGGISGCGNIPTIFDDIPPPTSSETNQKTDLLPTPILPSDTPQPFSVTQTPLTTVEAALGALSTAAVYSAEGVVLDNSNCRSGPGTEFGIRFLLRPGDEVRVVGVNEEWTWWLIFPPNQTEACWLWVFLLDVAGDAEQLQIALSPPTPTPIPLSAEGQSFTPEEYEQKLLELINQARITEGFLPLALYPPLVQSARLHSEDMAENDFFGHLSFNGADFNQRLTAQGMVFSNGGETLYAGGDPYQAYHIWMNSEVHYNIIMNPEFTHIGIGVVYVDNRTYEEYITVDVAIPVLPVQ